MNKTAQRLSKRWPPFLHKVVEAPYESADVILRMLRYNPEKAMAKYPRLREIKDASEISRVFARYGPHGIFTVSDKELPRVMAAVGDNYGVLMTVEDHAWIMDNLLEQLRSPASFLDVGCGVCPYTAFLVREGYLRGQVVGVDQMPEILGRAREVFERAQASHPLVLGTALRLPFADASFEHVFCNDALHWIKGWRRALNEMCRVLAPGGRLFVCYSVKFTRTLITERGIIEELAKHGIKPAFVSFDAVGSQTPRTIVTGCKE
ncbi:MAG: class I SAM-dependent methyltransferase [Patescibacteria group bacterium]